MVELILVWRLVGSFGEFYWQSFAAGLHRRARFRIAHTGFRKMDFPTDTLLIPKYNISSDLRVVARENKSMPPEIFPSFILLHLLNLLNLLISHHHTSQFIRGVILPSLYRQSSASY